MSRFAKFRDCLGAALGRRPAPPPIVPPKPAAAGREVVILAIHGIGNQSRNETIRAVANRLGTTGDAPVSLPLGHFAERTAGAVHITRLDWKWAAPPPTADWYFAEAYWADEAERAVKDARTLEETKAWVATIVGRLQSRQGQTTGLNPADCDRVVRTLQDMVTTLWVLDNLLWVLRKAGIFDFELAEILAQFLGDVQLVTEFPVYRDAIVARFVTAVTTVVTKFPNADIHVVAHSEGTVVSMLGILRGLKADAPWARHIRGWMTLGSPIDKHIVLWPELWEDFTSGPGARRPRAGEGIRWHNYYDLGDPVGFRLDTAHAWLRKHGWHQWFDFHPHHNHGFARYPLPGVAHNGYWEDGAVFEHYLYYGMGVTPPGKGPPAQTLKSSGWAKVCSVTLPYVLAWLVLWGGTAWMYTAAYHYRGVKAGGWEVAGNTLGLTALVAGLTLVVRLPRLGRGGMWHFWGWLALLAGMLVYIFGVSVAGRQAIGAAFPPLWEWLFQ